MPAEALAAALNVTVTETEAAGYLTVYPCGGVPNASNLNLTEGQAIADAAIAKVSATGRACASTARLQRT